MTTQFKDMLGTEIAVGDTVVHVQQQGWNPATHTQREVVRLTPKRVVLASKRDWPATGSPESFVQPNKLIVLNPVLKDKHYKWEREAGDLARSFAPNVLQCKKCDGPHIDGYICSCGDPNPTFTHEQDAAFERKHR